MELPLDGLLLVDKPSGPTSHDVVARIRRCLGQKRVGHAGTLDPMASGLLPLMLGRATRLLRFLPHSPKSYRGSLLLGRVTDTDDVTGRTLEEHSGALPEPATVLGAAERVPGRSLQVPPTFSARKVGGRRMYELARRGEIAHAPPAEIEVFRFELTPTGSPGLYDFETEVSRGTYVRGLARDLGAALGCGGTLASLVRTRIGPLELTAAVPLPEKRDCEAVGEAREHLRRSTLPLERIPLDAVTLQLEQAEPAARFLQGGAVPTGIETPPGRAVRVLAASGALLGIGEVEEGRLLPRVVLG